MTLPAYHTNADGTVPCTNCGGDLAQTGDGTWIHCFAYVRCFSTGPEVACPLPPNDDDPDFYDERGWARQ